MLIILRWNFLLACILAQTQCNGPTGITSVLNDNVCVYQNIRYGQLEDVVVGHTRKDRTVHLGPFAPIKPFDGYEHIEVIPNSVERNETSVRCVQIQGYSDETIQPAYARGQFDCFALHVRVPEHACVEQTGYPVAVFIHGGMYQVGAADDWAYEGTHLASQGVIVVTLNYRLNVFGFLGFSHQTWNNGVRDQRVALEWIRDHIAVLSTVCSSVWKSRIEHPETARSSPKRSRVEYPVDLTVKWRAV